MPHSPCSRPARKRLPLLALGLVLALAMSLVPSPATAADPEPDWLDELASVPGFTSDHADILRLYWAFFNREPDPEGAEYWLKVFNDDHAAVERIATWFSMSEEFELTYGTLDNEEFLTLAYTNVLGRDFDQPGFDYWLDLLDDGLERGAAIRWIAAGFEFMAQHPYPRPPEGFGLLEPNRFGPITIGATVAEIEALLGEDALVHTGGVSVSNPPTYCGHFTLAGVPGVSVAVHSENDQRAEATVWAIELHEPPLQTVHGLRVGDSELRLVTIGDASTTGTGGGYTIGAEGQRIGYAVTNGRISAIVTGQGADHAAVSACTDN